MEWIESSQALVRKEKTGSLRKIKPLIFWSFQLLRRGGPGFESQPAHKGSLGYHCLTVGHPVLPSANGHATAQAAECHRIGPAA